jgi:NADH-quinone oxidoreductase subunit N
MGIPPTAGFFGKYLLFKELILQGHVTLAIVAILASLVSIGYYLKPIMAMYMEPAPDDSTSPASAPLAGATVLVSGLFIVVLGLMPGRLLEGFTAPPIKEGLAGMERVEVRPLAEEVMSIDEANKLRQEYREGQVSATGESR